MAPPRPHIKASLVRYFDQHPNERVHLDVLAKATEFTEMQIRTGVNNLRNESEDHRERLVTVVRGQCWMYTTHPQQTKKPADGSLYFELVGQNKDGILILQDTEGEFYKAVKLS
jgi:hypothetical protein